MKNILPGWEIVEKIGAGGFSTVYKIKKTDSAGEREYYAALKVIKIPNSSDEYDNYVQEGYDEGTITAIFTNQVKKLEEEFHLMSRFKGNSNIVSYEDHMIVPHDDGKGWDILIRMELLEPLTKYCNRTSLDEERIVKLGIDICRALELCQKSNLVHRDIKPQNIFVNEFGDFKLGDFGIAKTMDHTTHATRIGTYGYIAPEVFFGKSYNSNVDIYSLGLVLYWLLNERRLPFLPLPPITVSSDEMEDAKNRRLNGEEIPAPKNGSEELKRIVLKACAFNPNDRYATASQIRRDLEKVYAILAPLSDDSNAENAEAVPAHGIKGDDSPTERIKGVNPDDKTEKVIAKTAKDDDKTVRVKKEVDDDKTERVKKEKLDDDKTQRVKGEEPKNSTSKEDKKDNSKSKKIIIGICAIVAIIIIILLLLKGCDGSGTDTSSSEESSHGGYISEATSTVSNIESSVDASAEASSETSAEESSKEEPSSEEHVHEKVASSIKSDSLTHWYLCECGEEVEKENHTYGEWKIIKEATETETGEKERICSVCNHKETETIPTLDHVHSFATAWSTNETTHWYECPCGEKKYAESHSFSAWNIIKEATETQTGEMERSCSVCKYKEKTTVPVLSHKHSYPNTWQKNETTHWKECSCGDKTNVANHSFSAWTTVTAATCLKEGSQKRSCSTCGYTETKIIAATGYITVTFDTNGGSVSQTSKNAYYQNTYGTLPTPTRTNYTFNGWFTAKTGGNKITSSTTVTTSTNQTLYAQWTALPTSLTLSASSGSVELLPTAISLNKTSLTITNGNTSTLTASLTYGTATKTFTATITPSDAGNVSVTATSSNTSVATVTTSRSGNVTTITITAKTNGNATITVKANGNTSLSKNYALTVTKNSTVTWSSSSTSVATVSSGTVTAKAVGSATITAKTSNSKSATCAVTVSPKTASGLTLSASSGSVTLNPTAISLNKTSFTIVNGNTSTLTANLTYGTATKTFTATVTPSDAGDVTVTATSSNTSVATVSTSRSGNVTTITITAKTNGSATITVKANGNTSLSKTYALTVTKNSTVTWTTSNSSIATVSNGTVTAKAVGSTTITAKTSNSKSATCSVTVDPNIIWNISGTTLTISGSGRMEDYHKTSFYSTNTPWFSSRQSISKVVIETGVTSIGSLAFYGCESLIHITIPDSVTSIGDYAFCGCESLTSITIPTGVRSIREGTFYECKSLTNITIPASVASIGDSAFGVCESLTNITIPDGVTSIGEGIVSGCNFLTSIAVSSGNTVFHSKENCLIKTATKTLISGCKNSTIPTDGSVTSIGSRAFSNCDSLTNITIPSSVTSIGERAFESCSALTNITIGNGVTSIKNYAFYNCSGLRSITIPNSVKIIEFEAFVGCTILSSVTFSNPSGWYVTQTENSTSGTPLTLTNASTNATYLKSTYEWYYWYRK